MKGSRSVLPKIEHNSQGVGSPIWDCLIHCVYTVTDGSHREAQGSDCLLLFNRGGEVKQM